MGRGSSHSSGGGGAKAAGGAGKNATKNSSINALQEKIQNGTITASDLNNVQNYTQITYGNSYPYRNNVVRKDGSGTWGGTGFKIETEYVIDNLKKYGGTIKSY